MKNLITNLSYDIKARFTTEFQTAVKDNDISTVDKFLSHKINVNFLFEKSFTPLWIAAIGNQVDMVEKLLKAGANPNLGASKPPQCLPLSSVVSLFYTTPLGEPIQRVNENTPEAKLQAKEEKENRQQDFFKILALLLKSGATPSSYDVQKIQTLRLSYPFFDKLMLEQDLPRHTAIATDKGALSQLKKSYKI